jgi:hypothetical protein
LDLGPRFGRSHLLVRYPGFWTTIRCERDARAG